MMQNKLLKTFAAIALFDPRIAPTLIYLSVPFSGRHFLTHPMGDSSGFDIHLPQLTVECL
jgi:hypothetical protein